MALYLLVTATTRKPAYIVACPNDPQKDFDSRIALALTGQITSDNSDECSKWIAETIGAEEGVDFQVLQTGISRADLAFFKTHWSRQFAGLKNPISDGTSPKITTELGRTMLIQNKGTD